MRLLSDKSGFGKVYEAYERSQPKILKVLKETHTSNLKAVELFQQEAIVLSQLHHAGIPLIEPDGYFQFLPRNNPDPLYCILMEKIDGLNLREWMRQQGNNPISEKQALNWLMQLTEILHLVHQKNYFHRDIKPENIMLRSNGQLVLVDFGAAREMTYTYLAQLGSSGGVTRISSAGYTPPEQEQGQAVPQSDFYALGRTFIYLLTGRQPTDSGIYDSLHNEIHWREYARQVSTPFADLIDRLIAPKAADRPKNTQEILNRLIQVARDLAQGRAIAPASGSLSSVTSPPTLPQTMVETRPSRPRWLVGGAVALAISLGSLGAWQIYENAQSPGILRQTLSLERSLLGHTSFINCLAISPDGNVLVSGSADSTIKIWDLATGKAIQMLQGQTGYINTLDISPDGQTLASGDASGRVTIWNLKTGAVVRRLTAHSGFVNALDISPDGRSLVSSGADNTIKVWNLSTGTVLHRLTGHTSFVNSLKVSPDGKLLVSGSADNTIRVWDLTTGKERQTLRGHSSYVNAVEISPDGQAIVSASADSTIKVWDLATGTELRTLQGHTSYVNSLAIKIDGKTLVSSSADNTVRIWNLDTGKTIKILTDSDTRLDYFVLSPNWQAIATGRGETTIQVWQFQD
jgi:WD40 repeat protein